MRLALLAALAVSSIPARADVLRIDFSGHITESRFTLTDTAGNETLFSIPDDTPITGTVFVNFDLAPTPISTIFDTSGGPLHSTDLRGGTPVDWFHVVVDFPLPAFPAQTPPIPLHSGLIPAPDALEPFAVQQIVFSYPEDRGACCDTVLLTDATSQLLLLDGIQRQLTYSTQISMIMTSFQHFLPGIGVPQSFVMENGESSGFYSHSRTLLLPNGDREQFSSRVDFDVTSATATTVPEPETTATGLAAVALLLVRYRLRSQR